MISIVVILYEMPHGRSNTLKSLMNNSNFNEYNLNIIIYDNSPKKQDIDTDISNFTYVHNKLNGGLAQAYNYALSAISDQNSWLLLLDQDSQLPSNFISSLIETIHGIQDESIVAVAPHILCNNNLISPCKVRFAGRLVSVSKQFRGASDLELMAVNSGMAVRASFMKQIGGFNQDFWLDYLDHWLCRTIYAEGKRIYVSTAIVNHDLSVSNYNEVSVKRAQNILNAEVLFYKKYKSKSEQVAYFFRLMLRSIKQLVTLNNKKIAGYTLKAALNFLGS